MSLNELRDEAVEAEPYRLATIGPNITIIVITGGPCSGKTTGMARLKRMLEDRGYKVIISPESATKLMTAGILPGPNELTDWEFQKHILTDTLVQENIVLSAAKMYRTKGRKVVILCDRGTMDGEAYIGSDIFRKLINHLGYSVSELCDGSYHAVMHLQTAAIGAEKFYTLENNAARKETPAEARGLDLRTLEAWQRHPHPRIIDNSTDFEGKIRRLFAEVCGVLGDPVPLEKEDKFLIESLDPSTIPVKWTASQIVQDYLVPPSVNEEHRVRARGEDDNWCYYHTIKRSVSSGVRAEEEKMITRGEYETLLTLRDSQRRTIKKRRICFFWKGTFIEVDLFSEPDSVKGLGLMEVEYTNRTEEYEMPSFIKVIRNVTDDKRYSNARIAAGVSVPLH